LPEALGRQVAEKAEGNPLFAEEIVSFLIERGMLHARAGNLEVDPEVVAASLPASVHSVLDARVDRLAPEDRGLLQAAAVIGRRFDPELLAVVVSRTDIDARLAAMRALDLVHPEGRSGDYRFSTPCARRVVSQAYSQQTARTALEDRRGNRAAQQQSLGRSG
jgi:predicted ATPase